MREINVNDIASNIKEMCIEANYFLEDDIKNSLFKAEKEETSEVGKSVLNQLHQNLDIAESEMIPICQDTGMAVVFLDIGQDVHFVGGDLTDAVNRGIREGYEEGYLRKSVVEDPVERVNTKDNTPAIIHMNIVSGVNVKITVSPNGFGSENMIRIFMLKPADGLDGIKKAIIETVREAGPNACPPFIVGVGIGGDFEKSAILAKRALTRGLDEESASPYRKPYLDELEKELLEEINKIGLGPAGLGGRKTALGINIETYPTHIAGMPLAINMCCHVNRHKTREI